MTDPIRTRPDGSIDTAHYIAKGRLARSRAAHDLFARKGDPAPRRSGGALVVSVTVVMLAAVLFPVLV